MSTPPDTLGDPEDSPPEARREAPLAAPLLLMRARVEKLLTDLPGIIAARLEVLPSGEIVAIHVVTTPDIGVEQAVERVQQALLTDSDLRVDDRRILVVQATTPREGVQRAAAVAEAPVESTPRSRIRRVYFEDVEVRRSRTAGVVCRVSLRKGAVVITRESSGASTDHSRAELAARATLSALLDAEATAQALAVESVLVVPTLERRYVIVTVAARRGRESVSLIGACDVKEELETAAALALLDATNRWLDFAAGLPSPSGAA